MQTNYYRLALFLVIASAVANSVNGLIVRSMDSAGGWQIVFYRSCFLAGALGIVFVVQSGWRVQAAMRELRAWALLGSLAIAVVNTCFILSMTYTTVANTMFVLSSAPFFTALLGWLVLGETVERSVWIAMGVALAGIGVMLWDGLGAGNLLGNSLAVLAALCFGTFVVVLRKGRGVNMLPVVILGTSAWSDQRRVHERLGALDLVARRRTAVRLGRVALRHRARDLYLELASRAGGGAHAAHPHRVHPVSDVGVAPRRRAAEPGNPGRRRAGHRFGGEPGAREFSGTGPVRDAVCYRISEAAAAAIAPASTRSMSSRGGA